MYIASAATTVKFHDFPNGKVVHHYQPGTKIEGPIRSISWSKDGNWLALVPHSGLAEIVSVKDQLRLLHSIQHIAEPSCAAFLNSTKRSIALGTKNGQVLIYDIKSRNTKKRFPRTTCMITHVNFTAKDSHCVAGCSNGDVLLYSNTTNNLSCTFKVPKSSSISALRTHELKRNLILGGSNEGIVVVWDSNVNKSKYFVEAHNAPVTSVVFSPVNSVMVLSTGLDRRFCIFDIESNERIAGIPVENSLTAVDFLDDGTYFAMASQNGRVYIYDIRYVEKPSYSFEAHNTSIKHLSFQKRPDESLMNSSSSFCSLNAESVKPSKSNEDTSKRTSDFFGYLVQPPTSDVQDAPSLKQTTADGGDSFIAALGLDRNNTVESLKQDESGVRDDQNKLLENNAQNTDTFTPNPSKVHHHKLDIYDSRSKTTSTPKFPLENFADALSPIINFQKAAEGQGNSVTVQDIQSATKDVIKDEIKSALDDIKTEVKYQVMHTAQQMRRMILDLQMAMVREFIKVENYCNTIREEINSDSTSNESYLVEENANLKRRIAFLEEQIAVLTVNSRNKSQ